MTIKLDEETIRMIETVVGNGYEVRIRPEPIGIVIVAVKEQRKVIKTIRKK